MIASSDLFLRVESACIYSDSGQGGEGSSIESECSTRGVVEQHPPGPDNESFSLMNN